MVFYAVKYGKNPGIYKTWEECEENIKGFIGAVFKKFDTELEANNFILEESSIRKKLQNKMNGSNKKISNQSAGLDHIVDSTYNFDSCINIYLNSIFLGKNGDMDSIGSLCVYFGADDCRNEIRKMTTTKYKNLTHDMVIFKSVLVGLNKVVTDVVEEKTIIFHTNSVECIKGITNDLEYSKNLPSYELIAKIHMVIKKYPNIKFFLNKKMYNIGWIHDSLMCECKKLNFENLKEYYDKIVFVFGKFKNVSFGQIFDSNPDYFDWCISNCKLQISEILLFLESKNDE